MAVILCEYSQANMKAVEDSFHCNRCKPSCCETLKEAILVDGESSMLAKLMGITQEQFESGYTFVRDGARFLKLPCPFYKDGCSIHEVRPRICREYPFNYIHRRNGKGYITMAQKCTMCKVVK